MNENSGTKFCVEIFGRLYTRPIGFRSCWCLKTDEFIGEDHIMDELITLSLYEYSKAHKITTEDINESSCSELFNCDIYRWKKGKKEAIGGGYFTSWEWEKIPTHRIEGKHLADIGNHGEATKSVRDDLLHWYDMTDGSEDYHEDQLKKIDEAWKKSFPWEEKK